MGTGRRLAVVTPTGTSDRCIELRDQAIRLGKQLRPGDVWVVIFDRHQPGDPLLHVIAEHIPRDRFLSIVVHFPDISGWSGEAVARCRNIGVAATSAAHEMIVELDDHDFIADGVLDQIRLWPDDLACKYTVADYALTLGHGFAQSMNRSYRHGDVAKGVFDPAGIRVIYRGMWEDCGGWTTWPGGNVHMARYFERRNAFRFVPECWCDVRVDPNGLMNRRRREAS